MRRLVTSLLVSVGFVAFFSFPVSLQERNLRGAGGLPQGGFVEERGCFDISGTYEVDTNWPKKMWSAPVYIWGSMADGVPVLVNKIFLIHHSIIATPHDTI